MLISEGIVKISTLERENINRYFTSMERFTNKLFKKQAYADDELGKLMLDYSNAIKSQYGLGDVNIYYAYLTTRKEEATFNPDSNTIFINLMHFSGQAMPPFGNYIIDQLVYDGMRENFEHEYVHFKQNELYKAATGRPLPSPSTFEKWEEYIKKPMEHMAFAAQELQWIKNKMHNIKPQEILRYLSKWGLTRNTRLDNLKRTDYDSWKNIMKYASMFALQDMAKKSTGTAKAVRLP